MRKRKKAKVTDKMRELMRQSGSTNFPLKDTCRLAGITIEQFAETPELQDIYRMAQIETGLQLRSRILADALGGNSNSIKIFLEKFEAPVLPSLDDMPEQEEDAAE